MKIYIVSEGSNSEYGIERIFLDKTKANIWVSINKNGYNDMKVEEWETSDDTLFYQVTIIYYQITRYKDGDKKEYFSVDRKSSDALKYDNEFSDYTTEFVPYTKKDIELGRDTLTIKRQLHTNKLNDEELENKYKKVCNDLLGQIDNLILNENWTSEMIQEWLNGKEQE
jgi:hypothetical protein